MRYLRALTAATVLGAVCTPLQGQNSSATSQDSSSRATAAANAAVTATGCLQLAADGKGFVLVKVRSAPGTVDSPLTSPAAGTSATGDAPSGSVTGRTPTGSTAVLTPAPLPDAGTPGETASPASPTYQQPSPTATAGTVARTDTDRREYRLVPGQRTDLKAHLGHTVEVTGAVQAAQREQPSKSDAPGPTAENGGQTTGAPAGPSVAQTLVVDRLRHLEASCAP